MSGARVLSRLAAALGPMGPVLAVLLAGFLLVLAISSDPILAYRDLLLANFYSASNFALFVNRLMPLMLIGLGVALSFRAGVFNVGGEGQLYLGAIAATSASLSLPNLPRPFGLAAALAAGVAAGACYGWIPGALKVWLEVNEVVSTLMLNFIALLLTEYLVTNPLRDPDRLRGCQLRHSALGVVAGDSGASRGHQWRAGRAHDRAGRLARRSSGRNGARS